ncbi:glutamate-1-semialdehyde aminotransferase [Moorella thermoacetica Y72]|uniref:Glutamate-1-semialdehyde aminotransferase n=1 Tax=Moorella thermoacetica Y72 TaxID=1325331 RepID=A0A0S6U8W5_NEOTH|nr:hypothetical protein [Moorella thermoacetica]GAF24708.1 glutamate-1-semialdehyde aminotransferase [Moorella thermoacetica Y72]
MLAPAGLFVTTFIFLYLIFCPDREGVSFAASATDTVRRRLEGSLLTQERRMRLETAGRTVRELIQSGALIGAGLALLGFLIGVKFLGVFALVPAAALFLLGIFLAASAVDTEFRRWQAKVLAGVPNLFNFVPVFLETGAVTPREALFLSLPFIPEPLRGLLENALSRIARKAEVRAAMDELAGKVKHPLVDAVAFRLSSAWDVRVDAAIFDDLAGQLALLREEAAGRATAARASFFALVAVLGLLGAVLIFGYPALKFMAQKIAGGFGM